MLALYLRLDLQMVMVALEFLLIFPALEPLMLVVEVLGIINIALAVLVLAALVVEVLVAQEHPQERLEPPIQVAVEAQGVLTGVTALVLLAVQAL